ncbi:transcription factor bHLH30-like [Vicia villosa]|uniref:transcription factor bHLH30-like n=1 Tax=Vicia villosa TaxID=3911 RepID=UPI00273C2E38|nr:transcription factor bHLH30-like [Vicia villosa]
MFCGKFSSTGYDDLELLSHSLHEIGGSDGVSRDGLLLSSLTERVGGKNENCEAKALAALKNHSEAERRRRERINGHLATLRGLVPSTHQKMDRATLLAKVISQVKELKNHAMEASKGFLIPMETDEVKVEPYDTKLGYGCMSYMATICCDYQPEILSDLKKTLDALQLQLVKSEMSTLESRMKNVFVFTCCKGHNNSVNVEACQSIANVVHKALGSVLEKASMSMEFALRTSYPNKRRRIC